MYLFLALFWFALGIVLQLYWDVLKDHAYIPVDRSVVGFICFVFFSFNFIRWRLARMRQQAHQEAQELPPKPRVVEKEYDPTFDFSKPDDGSANKPPL
jgi:hypothetical protein